ncbi:MAG: hypothetical protein FWF50_03290 [Defluviitaleaceae bacterium]|nr:hypothetical protein [Defluviitaleaceae bacterium]
MYKNAGFDVITIRKFEKEELEIRQSLVTKLMHLSELSPEVNKSRNKILQIAKLSPEFTLERNSKNVLVAISRQSLQNLVFENFVREEEEENWLEQKTQW